MRVCVRTTYHPGLLDVAHLLSWSDYPQYRADVTNVLPLSKHIRQHSTEASSLLIKITDSEWIHSSKPKVTCCSEHLLIVQDSKLPYQTRVLIQVTWVDTMQSLS